MSQLDYTPGPINCKGAFFGNFRLTDHLPPAAAPAQIEHDRIRMAARPGFNRKLLPLRVEPESGLAWSGGRYLLDTYENALEFADWVANDFIIDGVTFPERPAFAGFTTHVWHVVGACDFKPLETAQHVCRTEIWKVNGTGAGDKLANEWPVLCDQAEAQGRSALWLLYNDDKGEASLVTIAESADQTSPEGLDFNSIKALEEAESQGRHWENTGFTSRHFDRSDWIFTIWFPYAGEEHARPPLWPNSPPLPAPADAASAGVQNKRSQAEAL